MSAHFAAIRPAARSQFVRAASRPVVLASANDNIVEADEPLLEAALRHFGAHGFRAARTAFVEAQQALRSDDQAEAVRWTAICRMLDPRLAARLAITAREAAGQPAY